MSNFTNVGIIPVFRLEAVPNEAKSQEAGRPMYDDMEVVEIRFAGDQTRVSVFPAHADAGFIDEGTGFQSQITYAQKYASQYRQFKEAGAQTVSGTPLDRLSFLTPAERSSLKALNVHTAEMLANIDDRFVRMLGPNGRNIKNQATMYLGTDETDRLSSENDQLRRELEALRSQQDEGKPVKPDKKAFDTPPKNDQTDAGNAYDGMTVDELKDHIEAKTGERPRGNPKRETLVRMAEDVTRPSEDVK